jgi:hypothetical protein
MAARGIAAREHAVSYGSAASLASDEHFQKFLSTLTDEFAFRSKDRLARAAHSDRASLAIVASTPPLSCDWLAVTKAQD